MTPSKDNLISPGKIHVDSPATRKMRKALIQETVDCFYRVHPKYMAACIDYLQEITKVQTRKWKDGRGELKCQLPQDLFLTLRTIFTRELPDEPRFGDLESDMDLLTQVAPALMPTIGGARTNRGKKSR